MVSLSSNILIPVRLDYFTGRTDSIYVPINEIQRVIEENKEICSVHEICEEGKNGLYRFFMDIDCKGVDEIINVEQIIKSLVSFVKNTFNHKLKLDFLRKSDGLQCYHAYGNFATTLVMMKHIVRNVDPTIDLQVYKNNTSL